MTGLSVEEILPVRICKMLIYNILGRKIPPPILDGIIKGFLSRILVHR